MEKNFDTGGKFNEATREDVIRKAMNTGPIPAPYALGAGVFLDIAAAAAWLAVPTGGVSIGVAVVVTGVAVGVTAWGIASTGKSSQRAVNRFTAFGKRSVDPNGKEGPPGVGERRWTAPQVLPYTVFFTNDGNAAAQQVVVEDQLDLSKMDPSTFNFGPIAFANHSISALPGQNPFSTDVDLRPAQILIVRITAQFNTSTGLATWTYRSIDSATGLPLKPSDPRGFLPPDETPPAGEGSVLFTAAPRPGLPNATVIQNQATITFDKNAPISTKVWSNTIDNTAPKSSVAPLPAIEKTPTFTLTWSGTETNGPGIQDYTIYVSQNGGAFTPLLVNTTTTSTSFTGTAGSSYGFFSQARDLAGNQEPLKTTADATTRVALPGTATPTATLTPAGTPTSSATSRPTPTPTGTPTATRIPTATPTVGPFISSLPAAVFAGDTFAIQGGDFTKGSVANFFVATSSGPHNFGPLTPSGETPTQLMVPVPATISLGQGVVAVQVVNEDQGFAASNSVTTQLFGDNADGFGNLTAINRANLAATSVNPSFATDNIETVVGIGTPVVLGGNGFDIVNGVAVDLFCACPGGKVGPFFLNSGDTGLTATSITLTLPTTGSNSPAVGPGSFVVSNKGSDGSYSKKSNAVSAPIGARVSVTSVTQSGTTITVNGTGFSTLTAINFLQHPAGRGGEPRRAHSLRRIEDPADLYRRHPVHFHGAGGRDAGSVIRTGA